MARKDSPWNQRQNWENIHDQDQNVPSGDILDASQVLASGTDDSLAVWGVEGEGNTGEIDGVPHVMEHG
jgi:hypothetical protein